jgi:hypothetical protein
MSPDDGTGKDRTEAKNPAIKPQKSPSPAACGPGFCSYLNPDQYGDDHHQPRKPPHPPPRAGIAPVRIRFSACKIARQRYNSWNSGLKRCVNY